MPNRFSPCNLGALSGGGNSRGDRLWLALASLPGFRKVPKAPNSGYTRAVRHRTRGSFRTLSVGSFSTRRCCPFRSDSSCV